MHKPVSSFIGLIYFRNKKNGDFLSFISMVSTVGLALGVAALITTLSVLNGFERELKTMILGMVPQAAITSRGIEKDWTTVAQRIKSQDDNVEAAAPFLQVNGMLSIGGEVQGVLMVGVEPEYEEKVSILPKQLMSGQLEDLKKGSKNIILGKKNTTELGLALGDDVNVIIPKASSSPAGVIPQFKTFKLAGVYEASPQIESRMVFVSMKDAADALKIDYGAQGFRMKLKDIFKAEQSAQLAKQINPEKYYARSWMDSRGKLYSAIQMQKTLLGFMLFLIVLVAAFNIISSLVMVVMDKKSDMAILKTMGFNSKQLKYIFFTQGMSIAIVGVGIGLCLGLLLSLTIGSVSAWVNSTFNLGFFDHYYVDRLPSDIRLVDVSIVVLGAILIVFFSTLYPAQRAAAVVPAKELRAK